MSSDSVSVVSVDSVDMKVMMEVLEAPVAPAPTKKGGKKLKLKLAPIITPLAIEPVVEQVVVEEEEILARECYMDSRGTPIPPAEEPDYVKLYYELLSKYQALLEKSVKPKNDNSPDLVVGVHMRMVEGVKTKTKYIFPYQADGGKSIIKDMKDGQKCIGVSTTQKNNSKGSCKVADYDLIWVNSKIVKDTTTGKAYPHKDGKFAIMNEDDMTTFNVRMMIVVA